MSVTPASPPAPRKAAASRGQHLGDQVFKAVCLAAAVTVPAVVVLMVVFHALRSLPILRAYGLSLFVDTVWDPDARQFGAVPFIVGTLLTSAIAMAMAVPLGVGAAAFLSEIATGWVRRASSFLIELLAAIPSVVYGFWGV